MDWQMDLTYEEPPLYLIGRIDEGSDHLREWYAHYQNGGRVRPEDEAELERELAGLGGYLHVIDREGRVVQAIGTDSDNKVSYHPLEIITMQERAVFHAYRGLSRCGQRQHLGISYAAGRGAGEKTDDERADPCGVMDDGLRACAVTRGRHMAWISVQPAAAVYRVV